MNRALIGRVKKREQISHPIPVQSQPIQYSGLYTVASIIRCPQIRCEGVKAQLDLKLNFVHVISQWKRNSRVGRV